MLECPLHNGGAFMRWWRSWLRPAALPELPESTCAFCSEFPATVQCSQCSARFCMACCIGDDRWRNPALATPELKSDARVARHESSWQSVPRRIPIDTRLNALDI